MCSQVNILQFNNFSQVKKDEAEDVTAFIMESGSTDSSVTEIISWASAVCIWAPRGVGNDDFLFCILHIAHSNTEHIAVT